MGTTILQISLNQKRMADLSSIRIRRGVPRDATDDSVAKTLLIERIEELLLSGSKTVTK